MTIHLAPASLGLASLSAELAALDLGERIRLIGERVRGRLVFTTSFGLEDQALTHAVVHSGVPVEFVTLDTGRLFDETLELWAETELTYGIRIRGLAPDGQAADALLARDGPLGFRQSVEARQACCGLRKVVPLGKALAGAAGWLTGLRADQSVNRARTPFAERDDAHALTKLSPLADWDRSAVARYVSRHRVPTNPLHELGYLSIGCAPCTRAVGPGEPERAGRWWWEAETKRECGLHEGHPALASAQS